MLYNTSESLLAKSYYDHQTLICGWGLRCSHQLSTDNSTFISVMCYSLIYLNNCGKVKEREGVLVCLKAVERQAAAWAAMTTTEADLEDSDFTCSEVKEYFLWTGEWCEKDCSETVGSQDRPSHW